MKGASRRLAAIACSLLIAPAMAAAQDFERVAPKLPPSPQVPDVPAPAEAAPEGGGQNVLVPNLAGLVFVPGMESLQTNGVALEAVPGGLLVQGLPPLADPAFAGQVRPYLGRPLTQADLDAIGRLVSQVYRANERPFVAVTVPPQNVSNGIVQVVVTEYRAGEITVTGNKHFSTPLVRRLGGLESGDTLTLPRLREALNGYNQNPFLTVSAIVKPGQASGLTDVELQASDRLPLRVYGGYDNQGVPTLDRDEWYVGFNWGNVLGTGHILSYQFTRAFNGRYESHSASYVAPLGASDRILLFGAYATEKPFIDELFDSNGHSGQASIRWAHDFASGGSVRQGLQLGIDFKRTDNNLEFFGFRIFDTKVDIFQLPVSYTASIPDRHGETAIQNLLVFSPGGITAHNTDAAVQMLVPGADANYIYERFAVTRTTKMPLGMDWVLRGMFQIASGNLPYSEQIGGGGVGSVRGYDTNTALGSEGVVLSSEFRFPAFSVLGGAAAKGKFSDEMQIGVFVDYAYLDQPRPIPDRRDNVDLASVGFNVHYLAGRYLDVQVDVGWQLIRPPTQLRKDTQAALVATLSF